MSHSDDYLEVLDRGTCLELIRTAVVGRVAWTEPGGRVDVLPVNFIVDDEDVVFRTSEGSRLVAVRHGQQLSFEADDVEPALHVGWSVLISGPTRIVQDADEIGRLESLPLAPWVSSPKPFFVRIEAEHVTGRRIRLHPGKVTIEQS
jgi:uncharacterized protein